VAERRRAGEPTERTRLVRLAAGTLAALVIGLNVLPVHAAATDTAPQCDSRTNCIIAIENLINRVGDTDHFCPATFTGAARQDLALLGDAVQDSPGWGIATSQAVKTFVEHAWRFNTQVRNLCDGSVRIEGELVALEMLALRTDSQNPNMSKEIKQSFEILQNQVNHEDTELVPAVQKSYDAPGK
jgi:hypothetical protein